MGQAMQEFIPRLGCLPATYILVEVSPWIITPLQAKQALKLDVL
jgi:hypothetical protein